MIPAAWKAVACNDAKSRVDPFFVSVAAAFLLSTLLNANYILNHFYVHGAYLLDSGWLLGMFEGHDLFLRVPLAISGSNNSAYWSTHFSPTLVLFPLLHHLFPLSPVDWFALCIGVIYGLLGCAVAWILMTFLPNNWISASIAVAASLALIFSPPVVEAVGYPHFEYLFVSLALLFTVALHARRIWLAIVLFTLALGVREDGGFHIFAILATYLVLIRITRPFDRFDKILALFALYGLCWSVAILILQKTLAPGDNALARIYLGNPPFAHLNGAFIVMRIKHFLFMGMGIVLFWIYLITTAVVRRSLIPLAGLIAFVPWTLFNVLAVADAPSTLSLYYDFPLVLGFVWPLIHKMWRDNAAEMKLPLAISFLGVCFFATVIVSTYDIGPVIAEAETRVDMIEPNWSAMSGARSFAKQLQTQQLRNAVYVDPAIASLAPWNVDPGHILRRDTGDREINTVVTFTSYVLDRSLVQSKAAAAGLVHHFLIPNSYICIYSSRAVTEENYRDLIFSEKSKQ